MGEQSDEGASAHVISFVVTAAAPLCMASTCEYPADSVVALTIYIYIYIYRNKLLNVIPTIVFFSHSKKLSFFLGRDE